MTRKVKMLRRSQSLSPFGVGAVIDQDGESFVPADITWWKGDGEVINEPRLQALLGVQNFRMAHPAPDRSWEADDAHPGVPCVRFPTWHFCPVCRKMSRHWGVDAPVCETCASSPRLVPMRFVMACPRGHLADVPWDFWAHFKEGERNTCKSKDLSFNTHAGGSGLEFVEVQCNVCGSKRTLAGIASRDSLERLKVRCPGLHPWQRINQAEKCDAIPQVLQRGATNLTFALIASSIDIPPYSSWDAYSDESTRVASLPTFTILRSAYEAGNTALIEMMIPMMAQQLGMSEEIVRRETYLELSGGMDVSETGITLTDQEVNLLLQEYQALTAPDGDYHPKDRFIKRTVDLNRYLATAGVSSYGQAVQILLRQIGMLVQVSRLREVRALQGFSRLGPVEVRNAENEELPGTFSRYETRERISPKLVAADLHKMPAIARWLPAIEVFGEGIFFTLDEARLAEWEQNPAIIARSKTLLKRKDRNATYLPDPSPRLILLHTLAHILIRQLSFECGYTIASLRERLYVQTGDRDQAMAGVLIYTAAGDSEGTLGGLVRQGKPDLMMSTMMKAIQTAAWCSSDPLCRESQGQGLHSLNLAACHACTLLPETSCVLSNRLLDRIMLVGSIDGAVPGFFGPLLNHIQSKMNS